MPPYSQKYIVTKDGSSRKQKMNPSEVENYLTTAKPNQIRQDETRYTTPPTPPTSPTFPNTIPEITF
ncbi:hypothetical protein BGAL_0099g00130 [Botrytis galanthina]|uniref:Uncharacterized protein n=1 Tax=Botrytis galanthina TaxID=278940 RepID=A0A4S8RE73_9HELO|nr:hypothetical protein BGAL_0099g00130 [Botrytis galanthina]